MKCRYYWFIACGFRQLIAIISVQACYQAGSDAVTIEPVTEPVTVIHKQGLFGYITDWCLQCVKPSVLLHDIITHMTSIQ